MAIVSSVLDVDPNIGVRGELIQAGNGMTDCGTIALAVSVKLPISTTIMRI
jgi:hypothetical protein